MFNNSQKNLIFVMAITLLSACGGGGGGGGGDGDGGDAGTTTNNNNQFAVTFSKTEIIENLPKAEETIILDAQATGNPGVNVVYVGASFSGDGIENVTMSLGADYGTLFIRQKRNLWNGTYQGNITVNICSNSSCTKHLAKSPYKIPYTFYVKSAGIRLEPVVTAQSSVKEFNNEISSEVVTLYTQANKPSEIIHMRMDLPDSITQVSFDAETVARLSITNLSKTGFDFIAPAQATTGYHRINNILNTTDSSSKTDVFGFHIVQMVSPENIKSDEFAFLNRDITLNIPVNSERFDAQELAYFFSYSVCGKSLQHPTIELNYTTGNDWLKADQAGYSSLGIVANSAGLVAGTYTASVKATTCDNKSDTAKITLNITKGFIADQQFNGQLFFSSQTADFGNLPIALHATENNQGFSWQAASLDAGTIVDAKTKSGIGESIINVSFDKNHIAALTNNTTKTNRIQISDPSKKFDPVTVNILYSKILPEITSVTPSIIESGKPFILTLNGLNFLEPPYYFNLAIAPINNKLGFQGFLPITYKVVSQTATSAKLEINAIIAEGDYELIIPNDTEAKFNYSIPFIPHKKIKFIKPAIQKKGTLFRLQAIE